MAADMVRQRDLQVCVIPTAAGQISRGYQISTDKDLLPCPFVGQEEESCQKLAGTSSGPRL